MATAAEIVANEIAEMESELKSLDRQIDRCASESEYNAAGARIKELEDRLVPLKHFAEECAVFEQSLGNARNKVVRRRRV